MRSVRKKTKQICIVVAFTIVTITFNTTSTIAASGHEYKSKYIGQERREIKSLSNDDIKELRAGAGWGLAKAAELNGLPGPKHILEMKSIQAMLMVQYYVACSTPPFLPKTHRATSVLTMTHYSGITNGELT